MMQALIRYLRLYFYFLRFSFSRAMEFRVDFYLRVLMDCIYYSVNISFFRVLFLHTSALGGWTEAQVMVFVAGYLFVDAIQMTVFSNNLWILPRLVNKGDLDYYLVRPVSSLFFLSLRDFAASSFLNLLIAAGILVWAISGYPGTFSVGSLLLFFCLLLNGAILHALVRLLFIVTVFWTQGLGIDMIFWNLTRFMEKPDRIFTGLARMAITTILPFALMASFPARLLLEGFNWSVFAWIAGVTVGLFAFMTILWEQALRSYASASS